MCIYVYEFCAAGLQNNKELYIFCSHTKVFCYKIILKILNTCLSHSYPCSSLNLNIFVRFSMCLCFWHQEYTKTSGTGTTETKWTQSFCQVQHVSMLLTPEIHNNLWLWKYTKKMDGILSFKNEEEKLRNWATALYTGRA